MSQLREEVLVNSLKQVSLQRLRYLKMDMDKLARDSRIRDVGEFWSLLDMHKIRLDERMRREFGQVIVDNRGVNVEIALRHLKKAQRKTGRDSVEVLPKEREVPILNPIRATPVATPTVSVFKPSPQPEKRNYKLDKFRAKARGIGKLRAAFNKDKLALPSQGQIQNQHEVLVHKVSPSTGGKAETSQTDAPLVVGDKTKDASSSNGSDAVPDRDPHDKVSSHVKEQGKPQQPLLKILLHEEPSHSQPGVENTASEAKLEKVNTSEIQQNAPEKKTDNLLHNQNKPETPVAEIPLQENQGTLLEVRASIAEKADEVEESIDKPADDTKKDENVKVETLNSRINKNDNVSHELVDDSLEPTPEASKAVDSTTPVAAQADTEMTNTDAQDKIEKNSDAEKSSLTDTPDDVSKSKPELTADKLQEFQPQIVEKPDSFTTTTQDKCQSEPDADTAPPENPVEETTSSRTLTDDQISSNLLTSTSSESKALLKELPDQLSNETQLPKDGGESQQLVAEGSTEITKVLCEEPTVEIIKDDAKPQTEKESLQTELTKSKPNKSASKSSRKEKSAKVKKSKQEEEPKTQDEELPPKQTSQVENPHPYKEETRHRLDSSDSQSITTLSSDDSTHQNDDFEDIVDSDQYRWKEGSDIGLTVQWVYGCTTSYPQCMKITINGELIYFSGCVVIVYNHVRKTQRHYLEHSGFITGLSLHPNEPKVASSQLPSHRTANSTTDISTAVGFGETHIRVWNYDNMETITVIGLGIFRNPVCIMQFLDYQDYFVTIESDESCTLTLWEGGCRVSSVSSAFQEVTMVDPVITKQKVDSKRPKTSGPRAGSTQVRPTRPETSAGHRRFTPLNGPHCLGSIHTGEGKFVTAGKRQITFWRLLDEYDEEYVHGESAGAQLSSPVTGHFGGNFFKAEYLSCCCYTDRFTDGNMLTGDSNGTLLLWDDFAKTPVRGFAHAHECHLSSICVGDSGHIFTSGAKDKQVKAFVCRKGKIEYIGKLQIPAEYGSATCLAVEKKTLFVATEKNTILAVTLNLEQSGTSRPNAARLLHKRTQSTQSLKFPKTANPEEGATDRGTSIFVGWEEQEVCRGLSFDNKCVCALRALKYKKRRQKGTENLEEYRRILAGTPPTVEMKSAIRHLSKSAGLKRKFPPENMATYAWKSKQDKLSQFTGDKLQFSTPRLRAHERILLREKAREDSGKFDDLSGPRNVVKSQDLFDVKKCGKSQFFLTASNDGWLHLYNASEQIIIGRCKVPELHGVQCMDTSSRRQFVAIGCADGTLTMARINKTAFELFPPSNFYCSTEGRAAINQLRFSPSGCKLLVSVGCDVVVCRVARSHVVELARCVGHRSKVVVGLDWTKEKHEGSHYIRSCSMKPEIELKVWNDKSAVETSFQEGKDESVWATHSCVLNFNSEGQWSHFDDFTYTAHSVEMKPMRQHRHGGGLFCLGDVEGVVTTGTYPSLDSSTTNTCRAHITSITSIVGLTGKQQVLTTAEGDPSIVQWKISEN